MSEKKTNSTLEAKNKTQLIDILDDFCERMERELTYSHRTKKEDLIDMILTNMGGDWHQSDESWADAQNETILVPVSQLQPCEANPRQQADLTSARLRASLRKSGVNKTFTVTPVPDLAGPRYMLLTGHRTFHNLLIILDEDDINPDDYMVSVLVRNYEGDAGAIAQQSFDELFLDNETSVGISPVGKMQAIKHRQQLSIEAGTPLKVQAAARELGIGPAPYVSELMRLDLLPDSWLDLVHASYMADEYKDMTKEELIKFNIMHRIVQDEDGTESVYVMGIPYRNAIHATRIFPKKPARSRFNDERDYLAAMVDHNDLVNEIQIWLDENHVLRNRAIRESSSTFKVMLTEETKKDTTDLFAHLHPKTPKLDEVQDDKPLDVRGLLDDPNDGGGSGYEADAGSGDSAGGDGAATESSASGDASDLESDDAAAGGGQAKPAKPSLKDHQNLSTSQLNMLGVFSNDPDVFVEMVENGDVMLGEDWGEMVAEAYREGYQSEIKKMLELMIYSAIFVKKY